MIFKVVLLIVIGIVFLACYAVRRDDEGERIDVYAVAAIIALGLSIFLFYQTSAALPESNELYAPAETTMTAVEE